MTPTGSKTRNSGETRSADDTGEMAHSAAEQRVTTNSDSPSASQESPRKRQRAGISLSQKQALIDNLQLEITERARKLRAQYNLQAQGLRTRIEIRVNRIPMALRKSKMGELADKHKDGQHPQLSKPTQSVLPPSVTRPPPVPEKDIPLAGPISHTTSHNTTTVSSRSGPGRPPKRSSKQISGNGKENESDPADLEQPKKRSRAHSPVAGESTRPSRVLSPASSNIRSLPRTTPGGKSFITRTGLSSVTGPPSPVKQHNASSLFSNLAEKARSTRTAVTGRKQAQPATSTASSAGESTIGRRTPAALANGVVLSASTAKTARRISGISESSEGSTSTVVKKGTARTAPTAKKETKRTVMGTIRKGVTGTVTTKKSTAVKSTKASASTATGRVLRKRT